MQRRSLIAPAAVVFDFDLTLSDSRPGFVEGHRHAVEALGLPMPSEYAIARAIGTPLARALPTLIPGLDEATSAEYIRLYRLRADEVMEAMTVMLPGANQAVLALQHAGLRIAIVSQKFRYLIENVVRSEGLTFDVILGGEDVPAYKPDPGGLLLALQRLAVPPDDALYVGDTVIDAQAAANAGLRFIGVLTGPTTREELAVQPHLALLDSVRQLPAYLGVSQ